MSSGFLAAEHKLIFLKHEHIRILPRVTVWHHEAPSCDAIKTVT